MKKAVILASLALLAIGGSTFAFTSSTSEKQEVRVQTISGNPIADFKDKRNLVGTSDYLFLGKVVENKGQEEWHVPVTKFDVQLTEQLKGNIKEDEVVVYQYGGYEEGEGETVLSLFENDPLLEEDEMYIFAAIEQPDGKLLLVPGYGNHQVESSNLKNLKAEFIQALKNEKIPEIVQRKIDKESKSDSE